MSGEGNNTIKPKVEIAIVGAGIIGCCTAYYLTTHPEFSKDKYHITVYESNEIACAASGKSGGLLASWAFPSQLGTLSFNMHKELASRFDGAKNWDYRVLDTISLEADLRESSIKKLQKSSKIATDNLVSSRNSSKKNLREMLGGYSNTSLNSMTSEDTNNSDMLTSIREKLKISNEEQREKEREETEKKNLLPEGLTWIERDLVDDWSIIGNVDSTAQMHPLKFTKFMLEKAMASGAVDLIYAKVTGIKRDENSNKAVGISFIPIDSKNKQSPRLYKEDDKNEKGEIENYDVDTVVLAMGPWTSKILTECPISGLRAHSITVMPDDIKKITPFAMFTELKVADTEYFSPEIYARRDEIYVCGEGDTLLDLPDPTKDSPIDEGKCEELFDYAGKLSKPIANGSILLKQACYLPVLNVPTSSGPLIGETNVNNLYLASGHSCWGINNSVITGKLMSEIMFDGEAKSASIDKLEPKIFFDASQLSTT